MVKRIVCAAVAATMAATLFTGCVKVVKIGEEGTLTGQVEFNPGDSVESIWDSQVIPECESKAADITEVLNKAGGDLTSLGEEFDGVKTASATYYNYSVKAEGAQPSPRWIRIPSTERSHCLFRDMREIR